MDKIEAFWQANPVCAGYVQQEYFSSEYYEAFDKLREADECEPYAFSNLIHGYETSRGLKVLDVGCGNGYVLSHYAKNGAVVTGTDIAEAAVEMSRLRFRLKGLTGTFLRTANDGVLPFADESFDVITSMGVLHHTPLIEKYLAEIFRCLRKVGTLIVMLCNKDSYRYRVCFPFLRAFGKAYRGKTIEAICNMNDGPDCPLAKAYTQREVAEMLKAQGFSSLQFTFNKLSFEELFLYKRLFNSVFFRLRKFGLLPKASGSWLAKRYGWNMYIRSVRPN